MANRSNEIVSFLAGAAYASAWWAAALFGHSNMGICLWIPPVIATLFVCTIFLAWAVDSWK